MGICGRNVKQPSLSTPSTLIMLNRSCERCRFRKFGCSGGARCEQCATADTECVYTERKKRVGKRKSKALSQSALNDGTNITSLPFFDIGNVDNRGYNEREPGTSFHPDYISSSPQPQAVLSNSSTSGGTHYLNSNTALSILDEITSCERDDIDSLLREARTAIGFSREGSELLLNIAFRWRVLPTIHGCVQVELIIRYLTILFARTEDDLDDILDSKINVEQLTLVLLALSSTILFLPSYGLHADLLKSAKAISPEIKDGDAAIRQREIFSLAKRLFDEPKTTEHSLVRIQCIIIMNFHHTEDQATSKRLHDEALRGALKLECHRVEGLTASDEIKARLWWYFVTRDWLAGPDTWFYTIYPNQFSTRLPLNLEFGDLEWKHEKLKKLQQSSRTGWTIASYSLALISLAKVVRTLVDTYNELHYPQTTNRSAFSSPSSMRQEFQGKIVEQFKTLASTLLWFYKIEEKFDKRIALSNGFKLIQIGRVFIERWMLHQQIFHCFIELHEVNSFIDQKAPSTCIQLANHVLATAESCSHHCTILSASALPRRSLITAATVISLYFFNIGHLCDHEEEYRKVAIAVEKAKLLTGDKDSRDLRRLEALVNFWSRNVGNSFEPEIKEVIHQWKNKDIWTQGLQEEYGCEITRANAMLERQEEGAGDVETFLQPTHPTLSSILPAYQLEIDDGNWDTLWQQIFSGDDFFSADINQSFSSSS